MDTFSGVKTITFLPSPLQKKAKAQEVVWVKLSKNEKQNLASHIVNKLINDDQMVVKLDNKRVLLYLDSQATAIQVKALE